MEIGKKSPLTVAAQSEEAAAISVYDPAMCCSTGVCGPSTDPELTRIAQDLKWAESQGAKVERFNLAQEPNAFVENQKVAGLMQAFGEEALPAVLVNGSVAFHGRYPSRDELVDAVQNASGAAGQVRSAIADDLRRGAVADKRPALRARALFSAVTVVPRVCAPPRRPPLGFFWGVLSAVGGLTSSSV